MKSYRNLSLTALFAALTAAGAFLRIPAPAAPVTLQFFFTLTAGLLLGPKWGAVSQALYLFLGLLGLPIFTMGGGFSYVLQPSFGFLLALVPAAAVAGALRKKPLLACLGAGSVLYAVGLPYLYLLLQSVTFGTVVKTGFLLFLPGDCLKIAAAVMLAPRVRKALNR